MINDILKDAYIQQIIDRTADGQAETTSDAVDMSGFKSAHFVIPIGASAANGVVTAKLQQSSDNAAADDYSDIEGSSVTGTNKDNTVLAINIKRPLKRYLKCIVTTATGNSEIGPVLCYKYDAINSPITQGTDVTDSVSLTSPAEGTA